MRELAEDQPEHPLWSDGFAETQLVEFEAAWRNVDLDRWGWGSLPRPQAPDYEVVMLVRDDTGLGFRVEEAKPIEALVLTMHHTDVGWLVAELAYSSPASDQT